jgi:hypothetical protein
MTDNNGFIYIASLDKKYLKSAIYSAESLKENFPEANITLYTHEEWIEGTDLSHTFDNIVTKDVPKHKRAKLWALDKTPYDLTVYIDADMEIMSEEIQTIFDQMPDDKDILLTKIRPYAGAFVYFTEDKDGDQLEDHCGFFMYRKTEKTMAFMAEWWRLYHDQANGTWQWDTSKYPEKLRPWDQWTWWWLQNKTDFKLNQGYFVDDARWNFVNTYKYSELNGKDIIIYHHTID